MEKSFWEEKESPAGLKYDALQFDSRIVELYAKYIELQDMIKEIPEKFDLDDMEAQRELHLLADYFENRSLVKLVRNLLHKNDVAINQVGMFKACADDQTGTRCVKDSKTAISCKDGQLLNLYSHEAGYSMSTSKGHIAPANGNYSNLDTTVLDSKMTDELCSASLEILASSTESSIDAVNDEFQIWPIYPMPIWQPPDHPALQNNKMMEMLNIWESGKTGLASLPYSLKLQSEVYSSLEPGQKVIGDIINGYYDLIVKRSGKNGFPSVTVAKDYFLDICTNFGIKEMPYFDINFDADIMLFPMHRNDHWYTCLVDMRQSPKHIKGYDSLYSAASSQSHENQIMDDLSYVGRFLTHHITRKGGAPVEWKYSIMKDAPQQKNDKDCGVFTCKNGDYLATDQIPDFDQSHIPYHRFQIVVELETGNLSRDTEWNNATF